MAGKVEVEGLREVRAALKKLERDDVNKAIRVANKSAAEVVAAAALPYVPVRSGRLRATVRGLASAQKGYAKAGGARVPYAAPIHWGTGPRPGLRGPHNITARPFLWDAAARVEAQVVEQYEAALDDILREFRDGS